MINSSNTTSLGGNNYRHHHVVLGNGMSQRALKLFIQQELLKSKLMQQRVMNYHTCSIQNNEEKKKSYKKRKGSEDDEEVFFRTRKTYIEFELKAPMSARELAQKLDISPHEIIKHLPKGYTMEDVISIDTIENMCLEHLKSIPIRTKPKILSESDLKLLAKLEDNSPPSASEMKKSEKEYAKLFKPKAPVVTIMGHVDHGKTTLLDKLRNTNLVDKEFGGITQHIGAFQVKLESVAKPITFIDTPGHEAFTSMRSCGAQVTDIIVLVVAADDGVMPQTREVIKHAREANVPMIVAINKIDKPNADVEMVERHLMNEGIVSEEKGGDTQFIPISALKGKGLKDLIEAIGLQAEMLELKAMVDNVPMQGTVIECKVLHGFGISATCIVRRGALKVGKWVVSGLAYGKVKSLRDPNLKEVKVANPADPVEIVGFNSMPKAGDKVIEVDSEETAKRIAEDKKAKKFEEKMIEMEKRASLTEGVEGEKAQEEKVEEEKKYILPIILKTDVVGTIDAFSEIISSFPTEIAQIQIIKQTVGPVSTADIQLAKVVEGTQIIAMNAKVAPNISIDAKSNNINIAQFKVIYHLIDYLKLELTKLIPPVYEDVVIGEAICKEPFTFQDKSSSGKKSLINIAGCAVTKGSILAKVEKGDFYRVIRDGATSLEKTAINSLFHFKDQVKEVKKGSDCGISLDHYKDIQSGDVIQLISKKEKLMTFEELVQESEKRKFRFAKKKY
ncbi:translation initiation factor IF-2 [Naegleria gruberi]|uniref:Translation initiation factor IF-2, mitochondrial n=1 Tax=Naegleria gruberi TaxID=5762 RepID=D2VCN7_NAEGR|nr:translation initiation factor IF-2 [Naegleria gruberi]EFC45453.1 translation initiation factor IF-2 [Naegleria gruberi]|eukprot:XP_002678197.1 translation initiation factor IF-2 [Naegleria gruberi strain NEG-M]